MIPSVLFDKSFLQSLTTDESVWFDHFFMAVICPLFYTETLADLKKETTSRSPEAEVKTIARKFPESNGLPCIYHKELCLLNLLGKTIPMDGRIPVPQGKPVNIAGEKGIVFIPSLEVLAFERWAREEFSELEHDIASKWRQQLSSIDLPSIKKNLNNFGINRSEHKTLDDIKIFAESIVIQNNDPFGRMKFALDVLQIPQEFHTKIFENWKIRGYKTIREYAPYAAHVFVIEIFSAIALATDFISSDRASNWVDISYLHYLPFCSLFTSTDKLHKLCAPLFLRKNQHFAWGKDFKDDLTKIDAHYKELPKEVIEQGILAFAKLPPENLELKMQSIWDTYFPSNTRPDNTPQDKKMRKMNASESAKINSIKKAISLESSELDFDPTDPDFSHIERRIHRKKGSWYQLPKDLKIQEN